VSSQPVLQHTRYRTEPIRRPTALRTIGCNTRNKVKPGVPIEDHEAGRVVKKWGFVCLDGCFSPFFQYVSNVSDSPCDNGMTGPVFDIEHTD
jgi:hypothetical protein